MPQKEKITRTLDLDKRAEIKGVRIITKLANYSVSNTDSGAFINANNSSQIIFFNLPQVNTSNGSIWSFFAGNTGKFQIVGDTNAIVDDYGVTQKAINFGSGAEGFGCTIVSDGTKYWVIGANPYGNAAQANFAYQQG